MKNLLMLNRIMTTIMGVSVGIWIGMDLATYPQNISSVIYFAAILLTLAGACTKVYLHHRIEKLKK